MSLQVMENTNLIKNLMGDFTGEGGGPATAATLTNEGICVDDSTPAGPVRQGLSALQATSAAQGPTAQRAGLVNVPMTEQMLSFLSYACMR